MGKGREADERRRLQTALRADVVPTPPPPPQWQARPPPWDTPSLPPPLMHPPPSDGHSRGGSPCPHGATPRGPDSRPSGPRGGGAGECPASDVVKNALRTLPAGEGTPQGQSGAVMSSATSIPPPHPPTKCTPPPHTHPCQEDALSAAGRCQARKSRDRGDITPKPRRFWLR